MTSAFLDFVLPPELEAGLPAEARGLGRDGVRLLVGRRGGPSEAGPAIEHHAFRDLPEVLRPGDLLVVNDSGTLPAALDARTEDGTDLVLHFSTDLSGRVPANAAPGAAAAEGTVRRPTAAPVWAVEPRRPVGAGVTGPFAVGPVGDGVPAPLTAGTRLHLPGATATVLGPYGGSRGPQPRRDRGGPSRLWVVALDIAESVPDYLLRHGRPIRYSHTDRDQPLTAYQTVFATRPGSAEMPSAARPFTPELVTALVSRGVLVAPVTLHTGVASPEAHERPYPERFAVPETTARLVNQAHAVGDRVIAVGTTVVRALETAADRHGVVRPARGWTDEVITPERGVYAVDGLLTGFHEPRASHLLMLAAVAGKDLLEHCYAAAVAEGYLWHEFGDVNLLIRNTGNSPAGSAAYGPGVARPWNDQTRAPAAPADRRRRSRPRQGRGRTPHTRAGIPAGGTGHSHRARLSADAQGEPRESSEPPHPR